MCDGGGANATTLRSPFYPPLTDAHGRRAGVERCGQHADYGTITLLFQDDIGGLEVSLFFTLAKPHSLERANELNPIRPYTQ